MEKIFLSWSGSDPRLKPVIDAFEEWLSQIFSKEAYDVFNSDDTAFGRNGITAVHEAVADATMGFFFYVAEVRS